MLSILIPVYNTSVSELVSRICNMAVKDSIAYELCVADDGSTDKHSLSENSFLHNLENCRYTIFETNRGRTATSQFLAEQAKSDYLLFLDADILPRKDDFLKITDIHKNQADVIFGGISYQEKSPKTEEMLRWKYGKSRESRTLKVRQKTPYLALTPAALCITKKCYLEIDMPLENLYGLDIFLTYRLKELKAQVLHLKNPVLHLGIENSQAYLQKAREGLETLVYLQDKNLISKDYRPLQKLALKMKKALVVPRFIATFGRLEDNVLRNLLSGKPSLKLFDAYRLYYFLKILKDDA